MSSNPYFDYAAADACHQELNEMRDLMCADGEHEKPVNGRCPWCGREVGITLTIIYPDGERQPVTVAHDVPVGMVAALVDDIEDCDATYVWQVLS